MIERLQRLHQLILLLEDAILVLLLGAMLLLAGGQILLRNLFDSGLTWADPSLRLLVLWVTMLGAIVATREHRHIRIDLFTRLLHGPLKSTVQAITDLFTASICGLIAWHAGRFVYLEWQDGNLLFGLLPAWLGEIILPLGFTVLALRFAAGIPLRFTDREPG